MNNRALSTILLILLVFAISCIIIVGGTVLTGPILYNCHFIQLSLGSIAKWFLPAVLYFLFFGLFSYLWFVLSKDGQIKKTLVFVSGIIIAEALLWTCHNEVLFEIINIIGGIITGIMLYVTKKYWKALVVILALPLFTVGTLSCYLSSQYENNLTEGVCIQSADNIRVIMPADTVLFSSCKSKYIMLALYDYAKPFSRIDMQVISKMQDVYSESVNVVTCQFRQRDNKYNRLRQKKLKWARLFYDIESIVSWESTTENQALKSHLECRTGDTGYNIVTFKTSPTVLIYDIDGKLCYQGSLYKAHRFLKKELQQEVH